MKRLAIITTHPIQYNAPLFQLIEKRGKVDLKVFYSWGQSQFQIYDARFGRHRTWDLPLLEGYNYTFVNNVSIKPDSNHFMGIINPGLIRQLKAEKFDAILVYRWSVWSHFLIMQVFKLKTKLFFRGDSQWKISKNKLWDRFKKSIFKLIYRRIDKVFYVGSLNKEYFLKSGIAEKKLTYAPHVVDNERFDKSIYNDMAVEERIRLDIPNNAIVFLYAGKFYEIKQIDKLIKSFLQLKGNQYRLLLYGSGEDEAKLKEIARNDERIIFQSFKNQLDMPWVYRTGDVFVLPSLHETWGLSVSEAMASGRPAIVSSTCGCAPELILNAETGFSFKVDDQIDLLNKLNSFKNREQALLMGMNAFHHIQQFSLEIIAETIEKEVLQ